MGTGQAQDLTSSAAMGCILHADRQPAEQFQEASALGLAQAAPPFCAQQGVSHLQR